MSVGVLNGGGDFENMREKLLAKCNAAGDGLKLLLKKDDKEMAEIIQAVDRYVVFTNRTLNIPIITIPINQVSEPRKSDKALTIEGLVL